MKAFFGMTAAVLMTVMMLFAALPEAGLAKSSLLQSDAPDSQEVKKTVEKLEIEGKDKLLELINIADNLKNSGRKENKVDSRLLNFSIEIVSDVKQLAEKKEVTADDVKKLLEKIAKKAKKDENVQKLLEEIINLASAKNAAWEMPAPDVKNQPVTYEDVNEKGKKTGA